MNLIVLIGSCAVGKMIVGQELMKITDGCFLIMIEKKYNSNIGKQ